MILAGVALSSMFTGATTLLQYFADDVQLATVVYWTFGDLGRPGWQEIAIIGRGQSGRPAVFPVEPMELQRPGERRPPPPGVLV